MSSNSTVSPWQFDHYGFNNWSKGCIVVPGLPQYSLYYYYYIYNFNCHLFSTNHAVYSGSEKLKEYRWDKLRQTAAHLSLQAPEWVLMFWTQRAHDNTDAANRQTYLVSTAIRSAVSMSGAVGSFCLFTSMRSPVWILNGSWWYWCRCFLFLSSICQRLWEGQNWQGWQGSELSRSHPDVKHIHTGPIREGCTAASGLTFNTDKHTNIYHIMHKKNTYPICLTTWQTHPRDAVQHVWQGVPELTWNHISSI